MNMFFLLKLKVTHIFEIVIRSTTCVQDRCASLLFALKSTVTTQSQSMSTLIGILKGKGPFKKIAENMDLQYHFNL